MGFLDKFLKAAVDINNAANGGLSEMPDEEDDCPICGTRLRTGKKHKLKAHICDNCGFYLTEGWNDAIYKDEENNDDYDDMPEECKACGGPYPDCYTSCDLMDDD